MRMYAPHKDLAQCAVHEVNNEHDAQRNCVLVHRVLIPQHVPVSSFLRPCVVPAVHRAGVNMWA